MTLTRAVLPESFISQAQTLSRARNCLFKIGALNLRDTARWGSPIMACTPGTLADLLVRYHINEPAK